MIYKIIAAVSSTISAVLVVFIVLFCCGVIAFNTTSSVPTKTLAEAKSRDNSKDFMLIHDVFAYTDDYLGKIVELNGFYSNSLMNADGSLSEPESDETVYHFLTVFDEPKDCYYTIEFESANYEDLAIGDYIYVSGELTSYTEEDNNYLTLKDSVFRVLEKSQRVTSSEEDDVHVSEVTQETE